MDQQTVMARHMHDILGDMIWSPDTELTHIPTMDQLLNKIIIKVRYLYNNIDEKEMCVIL